MIRAARSSASSGPVSSGWSRKLAQDRLRLAVWLALFLLPSAALFADDEIPAEPARAVLIADAAALEPGMTFRLGVQFSMVDHWHIYWHSAREGGLGTEVLWKLPEGWIAGPVEWPVPRRYELPGPLLAFGYDHSVLLVSEITIPADFTPTETVTVGAELSWLVCRQVCVPGRAKPTLELPFAKQKRVDTVNRLKFDAWRQKIPQSPHDAHIPVREQLLKGGSSGSVPEKWQITIDWPGKSPVPTEFRLFPFDLPGATLDEGSFETGSFETGSFETGSFETQGRRTVFTFALDIYDASEFLPTGIGAVIGWTESTAAPPTSRPANERVVGGDRALRVVHGQSKLGQGQLGKAERGPAKRDPQKD